MIKIRHTVFFLFVLFGSCLFFTSNINAQAFFVTKKGHNLTEKQFTNLLQLGFEEYEINQMDSEELNYNKELNALLVAKDITYSKIIYIYERANNVSLTELNSSINDLNFSRINNMRLIDTKEIEITEEEYNNLDEIPLYSTYAENIVETTGKKLVTTISYISSSNRYRFKNALSWKKMPKNRYNELFGIIYNEPNANTVVGSQKAYYSYSVENNCYYTCEDHRIDYSNSKYWKTKHKSYYMSFPLKADETITYTWDSSSLGNLGDKCPCQDPPALGNSVTRTNKVIAMNATMYYDILKSNSTKITALTIAGEYQHSYKKLSLGTSLSFNINTGSLSIGITPEYKSYYDEMRNTKVQLTGINW